MQLGENGVQLFFGKNLCSIHSVRYFYYDILYSSYYATNFLERATIVSAVRIQCFKYILRRKNSKIFLRVSLDNIFSCILTD